MFDVTLMSREEAHKLLDNCSTIVVYCLEYQLNRIYFIPACILPYHVKFYKKASIWTQFPGPVTPVTHLEVMEWTGLMPCSAATTKTLTLLSLSVRLKWMFSETTWWFVSYFTKYDTVYVNRGSDLPLPIYFGI